MKRLTCFALVTLLLISMAACSEKKLVPGDKIGEMEFLNICEGANILDLCSYEELQTGTCQIPGSVKYLWVSGGWAEPTSEELELAWKDSTWKMTFDDHPVDLASFGTYDLQFNDPAPGGGLRQARVWNLCISNPTPGKHNARYDYHFVNGSRPGNNAHDWTFTILE